jgi:predicted transport protein
LLLFQYGLVIPLRGKKMVTSGLFQIKGNVKVKESVLQPNYFKPKSYWEEGKIVYNREGKGYISFGNKYISYRIYPNDEATHIPYGEIRNIELEDEIESISDPKFLSKLESNQHAWAIGDIAIKSILTIKKLNYSQNLVLLQK